MKWLSAVQPECASLILFSVSMLLTFRYMVDAADREKVEASRNELHNLLDKPQLQGIPVSVFPETALKFCVASATVMQNVVWVLSAFSCCSCRFQLSPFFFFLRFWCSATKGIFPAL